MRVCRMQVTSGIEIFLSQQIPTGSVPSMDVRRIPIAKKYVFQLLPDTLLIFVIKILKNGTDSWKQENKIEVFKIALKKIKKKQVNLNKNRITI